MHASPAVRLPMALGRRPAASLAVSLAIVLLVVFLRVVPAMGSPLGWDPSTEGPFAATGFTAQATNADGSIDVQAGGHPFEASSDFNFVGGDARSIDVHLPAGFIGNPQATPQCPLQQLTDLADPCPANTQVGFVVLNDNITTGLAPVYNLAPEPDEPSEFGFLVEGVFPVILYGRVRNGGDYGIDVDTPSVLQGKVLRNVQFTFWGVPGDPIHDQERGKLCLNEYLSTGTCMHPSPAGYAPVPFLTNPMDCAAGPLTTVLSVESWQYPGELSYPFTVPPVAGCDKLEFRPSVTVTPDTTQVDTPTGLTLAIKIPGTGWTDATHLATPEMRDATITLPAGLAISPPAADGLEGCTDAQFAVNANTPAACPGASQIATVQITTPLLASPLPGEIYLGTPLCSPCSSADTASGRVFRLFLQAQTQGALIKQVGSVSADPVTGQLTTKFENTPQLPFTELTVHTKGGSRAAFVNPATCATQTTTTDLTPWSGGPGGNTPDANPSSSFTTDWDGAGGACPAGGEQFSPSFAAGTEVPLAGGYSPFTLTFSRPDGDQPLSAFSMQLPPGLLGMLSSVPLCPEPQAAQGRCSAASQIGTTTVGAGSGTHPFFLGGRVYLTGPYRGAPFGASVVVPAVAGPYNLGNVVVRAAINVDPHDAHVLVTTDPLPQILSGVPTRLRTVSVTLDRPGFMFNPTNCTQETVTATLGGGQGASAAVSSPFDAAGCQNLPFKPQFKVSTSGRTSRANGASLDAKVIYPVSSTPSFASLDANVKSVKVDLPKQLPSRLTTLQKACTAATFESNAANCPAASVVGIAKASTPLLPVTLTGPAIFVSHGGEAFPSLEVVLQGDGVRVDLTGSTFISKAGITSSDFKSVPDVPIASFELYLPEGPYSALAANGNLCTANLQMPTIFTGQNGAVIDRTTKIDVTGCARAKAHNARAAKHRIRASNASRHHGQRRRGNR